MPMVILGKDPEWYSNHCALCGDKITDNTSRTFITFKTTKETTQIIICGYCDLMLEDAENCG